MSNHVPEHTVLAAFTVQADTREAAERALCERLPRPSGTETEADTGALIVSPVTSWWVAEDDRREGSDNDSAVFVYPGMQHAAAAVLHALGMTPSCNLIPDRPGRFEATRPAPESVATIAEAMERADAAKKARDEALAGMTVTCARVVAARIREVFPDATKVMLEYPEWGAVWSLPEADNKWESIGTTGEEDEETATRLDYLTEDLSNYSPREWDEQPWLLRDFTTEDGLDVCRHSGGLNRAVLDLDAMLGQKAPIAPAAAA